MKTIITISLFLLPFCSFAQRIEVTGQFVTAPITSDKCDAICVTMPTEGLSTNSPLFDMLTFCLYKKDDTTGIEKLTQSTSKSGKTVIYSIDGGQRNTLHRGINIVMDKNGNNRKIMVK